MSDYVLTGSELRLVQSWIIEKGHEGALEFILAEMDCTRELPIGRPMQTINSRYKLLQVAAEYTITSGIEENVIDNESFKQWKIAFSKRHDENVAFEAEHGVIQYGGPGATKSSKATKESTPRKRVAKSIRTKDIITGETVDIPINKPKKETVAERKAKAVGTKIANASFSFAAVKKGVNND